ncbi:PucR family transcriptional regulator [Oceanobacillus timonensis]|uniref:PucR family transcriptional regulator n=1 Tax=Oceanobacillus timonensis TaxID=1926285 RepID=UPI001FE78A26|nr:PucR family transcriptional regulator [Oceanobacillus timonensis]
MIAKFELTMNDILQRDIFKNAKVIAGSQGLTKPVKWTHILETNKFDSLINGDELILTTGAGLKLDSSTELNHMNNLIKRNVAGICVEIGTHVNHISNEVIQLADDHQFPIIIFDQFVKFVDITQDLHSLIINRHHQMLHQLNELSTKFNELSLLPNGILKILQEMYIYLKKDALYITEEARSYYYPPETKHIEQKIRAHFPYLNEYNKKQRLIPLDEGNFVLVPVKGLGQILGYLCLKIQDNSLDNFLFSVMDRAALAIAQIVLRNKTIEERKQNIENNIVRNLLHGKDYDSDELQTFLPFSASNFRYRLFLIQMDQANSEEDDWNELKLQRSAMFRSLFKQHGFYPAVSVGKNDIAIVASFKIKDNADQDIDRFSSILDMIKNTYAKNIFDSSKCIFGISKVNKDISALATSYQEAKKVLFLQRINITSAVFYENIGVYRLLLDQQNEHLKSYIYDCLEPIIKYDKDTNSELFRTLEVYLNSCGSKKEAADQLFIVRQTLYHRLKKIEELLGSDFMEPNNRLALELAIKAYYMSRANRNG